ncbi:hypothetical protein GA0061102_105414 [Rhizobium miluonense]|uniref:Uncharacterized protein n=1 Tax=Rhizobium miluonense TaxID=411945 RepID=A0A1C3X346_9HYPH|nr:hypothetical protein GA0061102_105414 [Rhizobium miluonense]
MQTLFRFMPVVIYASALFAIFLMMLVIRPTHRCGPFHIFRHHRTNQSPLSPNKEIGNRSLLQVTPAGVWHANAQGANLRIGADQGPTTIRLFDVR